MGWLIFLAILAALNCLPLGGRIRFDGQNFSAGVLIGKLPIRLYPLPDWLKRKMDRPKKEKPKKPQTAHPAAPRRSRSRSPRRRSPRSRRGTGSVSCP